ncbi:hypothetical protein IMX07_08925 [bacterium]|nr:hypothetical protein [bacterium]
MTKKRTVIRGIDPQIQKRRPHSPLLAFFRHRRLSFSVTLGSLFPSASGVFSVTLGRVLSVTLGRLCSVTLGRLFSVTLGLDPRVHPHLASPIDMGGRVKPGHDVFVGQYHFFSCHSERGEESLSDTAVARIR